MPSACSPRTRCRRRLICFSDDMDGLRKVPDNVPNKEMLAEHLGKPLTQVPDPFGDHQELRPPQQCAAQGLSRHFRLRLRVSLGHRLLHLRPLRRDLAQGAGELRRDPRRDPADAGARAPRHLQPLPADLAHHGPSAPGADRRSRLGRRLGRLQGPRHGQAHAGPRHARPLQAAMEGRLGDALGGARRRLRDGGQGPDRLGPPVRPYLPHPRRAAAGRLHLRALPRREGREDLEVARQRSHHRGVAHLRRRPRACRSTCIRARARRSGSIST